MYCICNFNVHDILRLGATAVITRPLAANYEKTVEILLQTTANIGYKTDYCKLPYSLFSALCDFDVSEIFCMSSFLNSLSYVTDCLY